MTTTPPDAPPGPDDPAAHEGPRVTREEIRDLGRLRRSVDDRKVAGVAGGLARHLDVDPLLLRVAFVVLAFFGGAGLLLYGACWLLVPEDGSDEAAITLDERSRTLALLVVGVLAAFALLGDSWGVFWFPWPLAIIALVVLLFVTRGDRRRATPPPGPGGGAAAGPAATYGPPRNPRRRGPILFWFTLALIALAIGVLGLVDVAGVTVAAAAYPALAVGITGLMLLVGSVYGRAGGLVLLGLLATVPMVVVTAAGHVESDPVRETPVTADQVQSTYAFGAGELVLDLTEVRDPENLDGLLVRVEGGAGRIELIVPADVDVDVDGQVGGPGALSLFGEQRGGIETAATGRHDGGADVPHLTIHAELGVGEIHAESE